MQFEKDITHIRERLLEAKKPIMFFDCDADGGTSYLQLKTLRKDLEGYSMSKGEKSQQKALERVEDHDVVVLFDTPHVEDFFFEGVKEKEVIWVDHHPNEQVEKAKRCGVYHFNPLNYNQLDSRPSCYWAYLVTEDKKNLPLVVIGTVTDYYIVDVIVDLYKEDKEMFNLLFYGMSEDKREELFAFIEKAGHEDKEEFYAQRIDWVQYLIFETNIFKFRLLFDFIYKMEYDDTLECLKILEKTQIKELIGEIEAGKGFLFEDLAAFISKLKKLVKRAYTKNKEKEFILVEHRGKTSFNRHLVDELLYRCKEAKVIETIFKKQGSDLISGSIRGKDGYEIVPLMVEAIEKLDGKGGGHPYAGGFAISKKDYNEFQNKLDEKVKASWNLQR